MTTIVILNAVLATLVVAGALSLLAGAIVKDKAMAASRSGSTSRRLPGRTMRPATAD